MILSRIIEQRWRGGRDAKSAWGIIDIKRESGRDGEDASTGNWESEWTLSQAEILVQPSNIRLEYSRHNEKSAHQQISGLWIWMHFYSHTSTQKPTWPTEQHRAKEGLKQRRELLNGETESDGTLLNKNHQRAMNHLGYGLKMAIYQVSSTSVNNIASSDRRVSNCSKKKEDEGN